MERTITFELEVIGGDVLIETLELAVTELQKQHEIESALQALEQVQAKGKQVSLDMQPYPDEEMG